MQYKSGDNSSLFVKDDESVPTNTGTEPCMPKIGMDYPTRSSYTYVCTIIWWNFIVRHDNWMK
jgi:hypothetical protein